MKGKPNKIIITTVNRWYSANGFIELSRINDTYFGEIEEYWIGERQRIVDKIKRTQAQLEKDFQPHIQKKNARRIAKVKQNDLILAKERVRRKAKLIIEVE